MKNIVSAKFLQNPPLRDLLLATGTQRFIEATADSYLGAAALLGAKLLKNGKWTGQNVLGTILEEICDELKREFQWEQLQSDSSVNLSASEFSVHDAEDNVNPTLPQQE